MAQALLNVLLSTREQARLDEGGLPKFDSWGWQGTLAM